MSPSTIQLFNDYSIPKNKQPTHTTVEDMVKRVNKHNIPTYELTLNDDALQKLYLDIDVKLDDTDEFNQTIAGHIERKGLEYIKKGLDEVMNGITPEIAIATSHGKTAKNKDKYSVRYFVSNILATKKRQSIFVGDINAMIKSKYDGADNIYDWIDEKDEGLFDTGIYDKNRKMRCIGTSKPNENRPLILKSGKVEQTFITSAFDDLNYTMPELIVSQKTKTPKPTQTNTSIKYDEIEAHANNISFKYIDQYPHWIKIIWGFKSLGNDYMELARFISKKSPKYTEDGFDISWDNNDIKTGNIGIIFNYSKLSDPIKYKELKIQWTEPIPTDGDTFENVAEKFELIHAKIINKSVFIKQQPDRTFTMFSEKALKTGYSHIVFDDWIKTKEGGYNKSVGFIGKWLNGNPNQRRYDDFVNNPYCGAVDPYEDKTLFNIWSGFDAEFIKPDTFVWKQDALDIILKHISILCNHQKEVADYIIKWIGQMIQYPKVKSICPTLISKEGAGKGTLLLLIRRMLGDSKVMETTTPSRDVWGTFNNSMANSFLVVLNELSKKDTTDSEGIIKGLITDPKITINTKGLSAYDVNSFHRFMITTNKEDPITSKKDDRRNLIIRSSDEKIGDKPYFNDLRQLINDDDVVKTCYEYFKSIEGLDKFGDIPMPITSYQQDIKEASLSPIEVWFKDYVISNSNYVDKSGIAIKNILSVELFQSFIEYKISNEINFNINNVQFGVRLKRLNINGLTTKNSNKGNVWVLDIKTLQKTLGLGLLINIDM